MLQVSHDRAFLDDACTDVLHISGHAKRLTQQRGNYSTWAKRRAEQQKTWEHRVTLRAEQRAKWAEFAGHGFKYGGSSSAINKQQQMLKQIQRSDAEVGSRSRIVCGIVLAVQILSRTPTAWHLGHQSVA